MNKICNEQGYEVSDFWTNPNIIQSDQYKVLKTIIPIISWCGTKLELLRRIQKVGQNQTLSCRERLLLKRIVSKRFKNRKIYYKDVQSEFPGKTVETLKATYESMTQ